MGILLEVYGESVFMLVDCRKVGYLLCLPETFISMLYILKTLFMHIYTTMHMYAYVCMYIYTCMYIHTYAYLRVCLPLQREHILFETQHKDKIPWKQEGISLQQQLCNYGFRPSFIINHTKKVCID